MSHNIKITFAMFVFHIRKTATLNKSLFSLLRLFTIWFLTMISMETEHCILMKKDPDVSAEKEF